jgi:dTDP-glucose 4,6-dehydratase
LEIVKSICLLLDGKATRPDGLSYAKRITRVEGRPGHDRRYAIDCTKIQPELDWSPQESFATGIEQAVDWYLSNRSWAAEISEKSYAGERLGVTV